jgi:eukaryotic-like serine/threonine-protein kinase
LPLIPGTRHGVYDVIAPIGAGGMGQVFRARDTRLNRDVAIKVLHGAAGTHGDASRRLLREARAAAKLDHPNICAIYEVGESEAGAFIVMPLVDGETLEASLRRRPLSPDAAVLVGVEIADALATAHERGVVHRDIKPANIMITPRGHAKVMDFGVATALPGHFETANTQTATAGFPSVVVGSLPYMSPEQLGGGPIDGRSDVFSLGVLLYEAVSGRRPFDGGSATATISAILTNDPPPLGERIPGVPEELTRIVTKALAKSPDARYQSARDLAVDLQQMARQRDVRVAAPRRAQRRRPWLGVTASALILGAAGAATAYWLWGGNRAVGSIAVMPFNNAADPEMEYLADGITDQIIDRLSQVPELQVMSHNAVFRYKRRDVDARTIGRELGVEAVLVGRLVHRAGAVEVHLELVNAADGRRIWGTRYDRPVSQLLALQREISLDISGQLRPRLGSDSRARLVRAPTENAAAYELYLKGRYAWEKWTADGAKQAIDFFEKAIAIDPNYALAYSGIADALLIGTGPPNVTPQDKHRRAREAATKALALDPQLGEPHAALAGVLLHADWNFAGAEQEYLRAIELTPSCAECHHEYSHLLLVLGRADDSLRHSRTFLELDPVSESPIGHLAYHYLRTRQYPEAVAQYKLDRKLYPEAARFSELADAYYFNDLHREAVEEYLHSLAANGVLPDRLTVLKTAFATSGMTGYLRAFIGQVEAGPDSTSKLVTLAAYHARLGDKERALDYLEQAYKVRAPELLRLKEDPSFDALHADPRFGDLLRRVGLPQ